jgi:hypothetical protein
VYGFTASSFRVTAQRGGGTLTLLPGVPASARLFRRLGARYSLWLGAQQREVNIVVTPQDGDPDLFVKVGGTRPAYIDYCDYR